MKLSSILIAVGLLLSAVSFVLPQVVNPRQAWSDVDAMQLQQASQDFHDRAHAHHDHADAEPDPGSSATEASSNLDEAKLRFSEKSEQLVKAQSRGKALPWIVRWIGVVLLLGGFVASKVTSG